MGAISIFVIYILIVIIIKLKYLHTALIYAVVKPNGVNRYEITTANAWNPPIIRV